MCELRGGGALRGYLDPPQAVCWVFSLQKPWCEGEGGGCYQASSFGECGARGAYWDLRLVWILRDYEGGLLLLFSCVTTDIAVSFPGVIICQVHLQVRMLGLIPVCLLPNSPCFILFIAPRQQFKPAASIMILKSPPMKVDLQRKYDKCWER